MLQEDGKSRLQQMNNEVEEVTEIMHDNLKKAEERSGKLNDLEQQAEDLLEKVAVKDAVWLEKTSWVQQDHLCCLWKGQQVILVMSYKSKFLMGLILCNIDVSKYTVGGAGKEKKSPIYILMVLNGSMFRKVFSIVC